MPLRFLPLNKVALLKNFKSKYSLNFQNPEIGYHQNFESLIMLDFTNNNLTYLEGSLFSNLVNLNTLNISKNPLVTLDGNTTFAIKSCINLQVKINLSKSFVFN